MKTDKTTATDVSCNFSCLTENKHRQGVIFTYLTMTNLHFFLLFFILIEALASEFCRPCLVQQCEFFCLTCFQKQKAEATRSVPRVLKNLNMTEKMSSNPGLTCAVTWKSCSDCKAAWVSIRLLHGLSVT